MAVSNSIAAAVQNEGRRPLPENAPSEFKVNGETVRLSPKIIRDYLTNGDGNVTDQEVTYFINLCKAQKLNPFIKDAYLIKYGNQPATIVTSKDAIMKRATRNERYAGHQAGIIVLKNDNEIDYRTGAFTLPGETLVGGWARVYVKGYEVPIESAVSFQEYAGRKKDGSLNNTWAGKPGVMIRKVALTTAVREAFPEDLQGMYASEEVDTPINDTMVAAPPAELPQQEAPRQIQPPVEIEPEPQQAEPVQETIDGLF